MKTTPSNHSTAIGAYFSKVVQGNLSPDREANQIFRPVTMFDHGIDGEVEFNDNDGKASGRRVRDAFFPKGQERKQ